MNRKNPPHAFPSLPPQMHGNFGYRADPPLHYSQNVNPLLQYSDTSYFPSQPRPPFDPLYSQYTFAEPRAAPHFQALAHSQIPQNFGPRHQDPFQGTSYSDQQIASHTQDASTRVQDPELTMETDGGRVLYNIYGN